MRHMSAVSYKALRNYFAPTWRHAFCHASLFVVTAFMTLHTTAHACVTAADVNRLESRIESNNIESPLGGAVDGIPP
jgi:hypothetical protein